VKQKTVTLDVREELAKGREPFSLIMGTVYQLKPGQDLLLLVPFEPAPLYAVLAQHGFGHSARELASGDWEVRFSRSLPSAQKPNPSSPAPIQTAEPLAVDVDARGLEPPEPMVKILEAVAAFAGNALLRARTDRRPMHLYSQLEARGFTSETSEQSDGSYVTLIRRVQ
jgi:uncharacterized protein (DUF2249 family)